MSEVVRLYRYKRLLSGRRTVSANDLMTALEVSRATVKRDIAKLRDQLHVPIVYHRDQNGYTLDQGHTDSELPGLWFSQDELLALVTVQQLLEQLEPGLLGAKLRPLKVRLSQLMDKSGLSSQDVAKRIRIVHAGKRVVAAKHFEVVAAATLARKRLDIQHLRPESGTTTQRQVSPQRLVHYRDNWYLDAWCHLREELRSFSVDALAAVELIDMPAQEIEDTQIDAAVSKGYGIFAGAPLAWAKLRFTPERARWVAKEQWHPLQESYTQADGSYVLALPYSDDRELVGDILRFGGDVEVVEPLALRTPVKRALHEAVGRYV